MDQDYITLQEAARIMEKSVQTLRRLIKRGGLKVQRVKTPQGFHYILSRRDLEEKGYFKQKQMFSDSTIQNDGTPHKEEDNSLPPIQGEILTSQTHIVVHKDKENRVFDRQTEQNVALYEKELKALHSIIKAYHQEKIALFKILEKLQDELSLEQAKSQGFRNFIIKYFD